ncbi:cell division inhibitor SulA [Orbus hercynius]|uniref:Cell division inhibitor SulA n=1 Tax=Orbus hercynius TaxID=593135 RepID=A0A495RJJ2_9GAMM|nr:SulA-like leucine-rich domain-containing protein [Orbus hercynius]RKS87501.1 cell division inhibitor SulA [Orbus hercynius]
MLRINKLKLANQIYLAKKNQLDSIGFDTPLQQVLQQQTLLLRLLNQQHKWQLWLSTRPMLQRRWIKQAGLQEKKVVHLSNVNRLNMISIVEKALLSKTSSYIVACIDDPLSENDTYRLQQAVKSSGTHLFLIDSHYSTYNKFMTMSLAVNPIH